MDVLRSFPLRPSLYAAIVILVFGLELYFVGPNIYLVSLGYLLLIGLTVDVLWRRYAGLVFPGNALVWVSFAYVAWCAATLLWTPVSFISIALFWWTAAFPLIFWLYLLIRDDGRVWLHLSVGLLVGAIALAGYGLYQWWIQGVVPKGPFLDQNLYATTLNLFALATAGYYFRARSVGGSSRSVAPWLAVAFFLLIYASTATKGRGPMLTLIGGAALLVVASWPYVARRVVAELVVLGALAFLFANLGWHGGMADRLETLATPYAAGASRFVIWRQSWRMLMDHPWFGVGLGMYPLLWPPYRDPVDDSAGFFVHNDYLNIWIEVGLPGLILFVAMWLILAWRIVDALRRPGLAGATKIEIAGLGAALASMAAHALLEFDFYVITTLLLCGLMIGRLVTLTAPAQERTLTLLPSRYLGRRAYQLLTLLVLLFPAVYFARIGIASVDTDRGLALAKQGDWLAAEAAMVRALKLWPESDAIHMSLGDLYRQLIAANAKASPEQRKLVFDRALTLLNQAVAINPLRAQNYGVRAELVRQNPRLVGDATRAYAMVDSDYSQALRRDPLYVFARVRYASFLLEHREPKRARQVLEAGLAYRYPPADVLVSYYLLSAKVREQDGDTSGAKELLERANAAKMSLPGVALDTHMTVADH